MRPIWQTMVLESHETPRTSRDNPYIAHDIMREHTAT